MSNVFTAREDYAGVLIESVPAEITAAIIFVKLTSYLGEFVLPGYFDIVFSERQTLQVQCLETE